MAPGRRTWHGTDGRAQQFFALQVACAAGAANAAGVAGSAVLWQRGALKNDLMLGTQNDQGLITND